MSIKKAEATRLLARATGDSEMQVYETLRRLTEAKERFFPKENRSPNSPRAKAWHMANALIAIASGVAKQFSAEAVKRASNCLSQEIEPIFKLYPADKQGFAEGSILHEVLIHYGEERNYGHGKKFQYGLIETLAAFIRYFQVQPEENAAALEESSLIYQPASNSAILNLVATKPIKLIVQPLNYKEKDPLTWATTIVGKETIVFSDPLNREDPPLRRQIVIPFSLLIEIGQALHRGHRDLPKDYQEAEEA